MKQIASVKLEIEKNERMYEFFMPIGAPYGEAYDTLFEMLQEVTMLSQKAAEMAKRPESAELNKEGTEEVVAEVAS